MTDNSSSDAYRQGIESPSYDNPYKVGTSEYNDFERGWAQRVKRNYKCVTKKRPVKQPSTFQEKYKHARWK